MIELTTFGAIELRRDGTDVRSVLSQPKRFALLAYLRIAAPGGFVARERLLGLFWPESDPERARNALRQALHFLRRSLGDGVVVGRGDHEIGIDQHAVACDAVAFREALDHGRLEQAVDAYRGEFRSGLFLDDAPELERWLESQRAELARQATDAAWSLSRHGEASGELAAAVLWARRAVALDPLGEPGVRRLMELLGRAGDRARALDAYRELARRLAEELDLEPAGETTRLADAIRSQDRPADKPTTENAAGPPQHAAPHAARDAGVAAPPARPAPVSAGPAATATLRPYRSYSRRSARIGAGIAMTVAAAILTLFGIHEWRVVTAHTSPSVAVLPFLDLSPDAGSRYFSDGLAEELLNVLASVPGLRVAARTSSFVFRDGEATADSIGRALGVTHLVEGSVRTSGDRVRITAQLIEARGGFHLWSDTYDRRLDDIFTVQEEIAAAIAEKLQVRLAGDPWNASARETRDPEAHRLLLRALHVSRIASAANYAAGVSYLQDAIRRDPGYARAYGALAGIRLWQAYMGFTPAPAAYAAADSLARQSLALAETPEAHIALGRLAEVWAWNADSADAHYRRALELNPSNVRALTQRALFLAHLGRTDEALALARRATEVDPLHPASWVNRAAVLSVSGRQQDAVRMMERARTVAPSDVVVLVNVANQYSLAGRLKDAITTADSALAIDSTNLYLRALRTHLLFQAGQAGEARASLAELERHDEFPRLRIAYLYTNTPDTARVLDLLEESAARREQDLPQIRNPEFFRSVRDHPRFLRLLAALDSGGGVDGPAPR
ncbi:MAG: BTAD domain-containing putative transcriptional regulator [Gemmatimonadota bacterium]